MRLNRKIANTVNSDIAATILSTLFLVVLVLNPAHLVAGQQPAALDDPVEPDHPVEPYYLDSGYFKKLLSDTGLVLISPTKWDKSAWTTALLVAGTTIGIYAIDERLRDWSQQQRNDTTDAFADLGSYLGSGTNVIITCGAWYLYGDLFHHRRARKTALLGFKSVAISSLITYILKQSFHRSRPYTGAHRNAWDGPALDLDSDHLSFPSGHSTAAFSLATAIASQYQDYPAIPPLVYGLATLTAFSRVNKNVHWGSDVFMGFAIGYFTTKYVVKLSADTASQRLLILPLAEQGGGGVSFKYMF